MEHIVQFAFSIDDQAIQNRLEKSAYNDIINKLMEDCINHLPKIGYPKQYVNWDQLTHDMLENFISEHKNEIIESAATKLKESFVRTKAFKDKMKETMDEA